jgi:hypothetical protein
MNKYPWFVNHKNILRGAILLLLIISLFGPWTFDQINVPAQYTCSPPNVRLYGDFCGVPLSGFQVFGLYVGGLFYMFLEMIRGTFGSRFRDLFVGLLILPLIPFLTTLLSIWKKETHRLRTINLFAWILALIPVLTIFTLQINRQSIRLWGLWIYIAAAVCAVVLEIIVMKISLNE